MTVEVKVSGVEGALYENVLSLLTINLQKTNERLQEAALRRLHKKAKKDIEGALAPFGYYNGQISSLLKNDEGKWLASYQIDKGPPVIIDSIDLQVQGIGGSNTKIREVVAAFQLKKGDILNQQIYEKEKKKLVNTAFGEGFLKAQFVSKNVRVDVVANLARISLAFDTGPQYFFGQTETTGDTLNNKLFNKYLPYRAGDPYQSGKMYELQSILYKTDYFGKVKIRGLIDAMDGYAVPVQVDLMGLEHYNKYSFGAGYATDTGFRVKADWKNRLLNLRGHKMSSGLQLAEYENTFSLLYEIPQRDPRYDKLVHSVAYQDKTWEDTTTRLMTGAVSREYAGPRYKYSAGLELRDEVYDVGDTSGSATMLLPSLHGGFVVADDILYTQKGLQGSVGLLGALDGVVSDVSFLQATVNGKAIVSPVTHWRLIGRGALGATLVDSIDSLPPSLRFYTGGDTTIRGFKYKSIGSEDSSGTVIGGTYLVVGSIEGERQVSERWSLAAFWDSGSATDDLSLDFYQGVGSGIRFRLPFGQVRVDVAWAISEVDYPFRLHLTVGGDL